MLRLTPEKFRLNRGSLRLEKKVIAKRTLGYSTAGETPALPVVRHTFFRLNRVESVTQQGRVVKSVLAALMFLGFLGTAIFAQDQPATPATALSEFDKTSLNLRTALHYDPAIAAPLESLVKLYKKADRTDDLIALYRGHITQYPEDAGAKAVLTRIFRNLNRAEAGELITTAVQLHPEDPVLQHLLYQHLNDRNDPRAVEALSRAIDLETENPGRRDGWLEELLKAAGEGKGRELAIGHLTQLLAVEGQTAVTLQALSARMQRYGFWELSLAAVTAALGKEPDAEAKVELQVQAAKAEAALGNRAAAGKRLDTLMEKLAPDYWKRREIMSLRVNFLADDAERDAMLAAAKNALVQSPASETAVLDYVDLLVAGELRGDAVAVLKEATEALPNSARIEAKALELLERIGDNRELAAYLEKRLEVLPERDDLRYRLAKAQFLTGKPTEAEANFDEVLARLAIEERGPRLLDLGRFLRNENLPKQAVQILGQFLESNPNRLDVLRELAETHLALGDKSTAREVVGKMNVSEAEIENFLDVVQFMVRENFLTEAKTALETRLGLDPEQFDLRLLLTRVLGKTGDREKAESLLNSTRELADGASRYRSWLETGMEVHEIFDDTELFFLDEVGRVKTTGDGAVEGGGGFGKMEKFLILCDVGESKGMRSQVALAIRAQLLADGIGLEAKLQLRRLLVSALGSQPNLGAEIEEQLKLLATEDAPRKDEYNLRRALLYHSLNRPDLTTDALDEVKVANVSDVDVLRAAAPVFIEFGMIDAAKITLERITRAEPGFLGNWEKRLSLLAALGQETELRKVIRDLLAGLDRVDLDRESLERLRWHLLDSHWRSVAGLLSQKRPEALTEVFPLLESVEREATGKDRLWGLWARAFALNSLGRTKARDAAIKELAAVAFNDQNDSENDGAETQIVFPDGLAIALPAAMDLLSTSPEASMNSARKKTEGPLADPRMAWAFEADDGARVLQIEPIENETVLILDDRGTIYSIDSSTGKLRWREQYDSSGAENSGSANRTNLESLADLDMASVKIARQFATDGKSRFFLTFGDEIRAFAAEDGAFLWQTEITGAPEEAQKPVSNQATPDISLALDDTRLIAFSPGKAVAAGFSAESGKLLWERPLQSAGREKLFSLNTGMTVSAGRVFVYGSDSVILDAESGDPLWRFDGTGVRTFPVKLQKAPKKEESAERLPLVAEQQPVDLEKAAKAAKSLDSGGILDHLAMESSKKDTVKSFVKSNGSLVAPAVKWSEARLREQTPAMAALSGDRLLLMDKEGVREISLQFPLASRLLPVSGTFIGVAGDSVWFLKRTSIVRIDLGTRGTSEETMFTISLSGLVKDSGSSALMSGSRVYVTGENGLAIFNAHTGQLISENRWAKDFQTYKTERTDRDQSKAPLPGRYVLQGLVKPRASNGFLIATPPVARASRATLYTVIEESSVVAFRGE